MTAAHFDYDSATRRPSAIEELAELRRSPALLPALVGRNIKTRYKRSALGFAWSLLNPAAMMIVLTFVFANHFAAQAPHYSAYVFPGLLMWNFFAQTVQIVAMEVAAGVDLWRRVRIPKTALAIATSLTGLVNLVLSLVPLLLILVAARLPLGAALLTLPITMAAATAFALGFALLVASVALDFPDVADVLSMAMPAWMFLTPVIYPLSILPARIRPLLRFNPMTLYVEAFRAPLYDNASPTSGDLAILTGIGAASLFAGWLLFTRRAHDITYGG